ncbi:MAG: zinc ABC transporter substrate-binding protein [Ignavibacteria bacterium]|jgi:zinc transport system substrate-binding protein
MKKIIIFVFLILIGCNEKPEKKENIFVSILPQKFFVEKIAGYDFNLNVMVRPGMSPATYDPLPNQLIELSKASIYFTIGVPFEKVLLKKIRLNFEDVRLIDTRNGIKLRMIESHTGGHSYENKNINNDPHIWLSPELVKIQVKNILSGLIEINSYRQDFYEKNYNIFINELDSLQSEIKGILSNARSNKFLVYHPSFGYFCDEFRLKQIPIELEGKEPTGKDIAEIIDVIEKEDINLLFVQKQFTSKLSEKISNLTGIKIVEVDPLSEDYYNNLTTIAKTIAENIDESTD